MIILGIVLFVSGMVVGAGLLALVCWFIAAAHADELEEMGEQDREMLRRGAEGDENFRG